jgi:MFS family permease
MDASAPVAQRRGKRMLLAALVLVALLGVVAVASSGEAPAGSGGVRRPADRILDVAVSLFLVALLLGALLFVALLVLGRRVAAEELRRRERRRRPLLGLASLGLVAGALLLTLRLARRTGDEGAPPEPAVPAMPAGGPGSEGKPYEPVFAAVPVLVVLCVVAAGAAAALLAHRASGRRGQPAGPRLELALAGVLDEAVDDLRAEPDLRRAVIAAYARLERALAFYGLPRRAAEAPNEYLARVLAELEVGRRAVTGLTELFAQAKFSRREIRPEMRDRAVDALVTVREELRDAELRAAAERAESVAAAQERDAG